MNQDIKFEIISMLKSRGAYHKSVNGIQHYTRCPYCGDSSNLSHAHLSIKIDVNSDVPMVFKCFKCNVYGLLTETVLEELDLPINPSLVREIKSYNRKSMRLGHFTNTEEEKYIVPLYQDIVFNRKKLDYINNRIDTSIDFFEAHDLKFVLNIFDFMCANNIDSIDGISYPFLYNLNENYVGFLSCNKNCIVFRDISESQKYRYFKVTLNQKNVNPNSFYSIPYSIPLMYTHPIDVHIAEGIFDILSIKKNIVKKEESNYYFAICGFGGLTILKYLIRHGLNTGIRLHIYSDRDKTDWDHKSYLTNSITEWIDEIYIHRNQTPDEKDYGISINRIKDSMRKIK